MVHRPWSAAAGAASSWWLLPVCPRACPQSPLCRHVPMFPPSDEKTEAERKHPGDPGEEKVALPKGFHSVISRGGLLSTLLLGRSGERGERDPDPFSLQKGQRRCGGAGKYPRGRGVPREGTPLPHHWAACTWPSLPSSTWKLAQILGVGFCGTLLGRSAGGGRRRLQALPRASVYHVVDRSGWMAPAPEAWVAEPTVSCVWVGPCGLVPVSPSR